MNSGNNITPSSIAQEQLEAKRAENPIEIRGLSAQEKKLLELRQAKGEVRKDYFVMYPPYYKHIKAVMKKETFVTDEAQFFECLCEYGLYGKEPSDNLEDNALFDLFWEDCKRQIDKSREKDKTKTNEGFTFKASFFSAVYDGEQATNAEWLTMLKIYCLYGFDMVEPVPEELQSLSSIARKCWAVDKPHFVANWVKVYNGHKGGRPKPTNNQDITKPNQDITKPNQDITKPNQPLSNNKEKEKDNKNINIKEKENKNENGNEVASSSLSQDNNFSSSLSSPTLRDIEDFILSDTSLLVIPEEFYNYHKDNHKSFGSDWQGKIRNWNKAYTDPEERKHGEEQLEKIRVYRLRDDTIQALKDNDINPKEFEEAYNIEPLRGGYYENDYFDLNKKGITKEIIISTYKLLLEIGYAPHWLLEKGADIHYLPSYIYVYQRLSDFWKWTKLEYDDCITTLKKKGINADVIESCSIKFFSMNYWGLYNHRKIHLLYEAINLANEEPQQVKENPQRIYEILDDLCRKEKEADQAKAEQEQKAGDEAQDIKE